MNLALGSAYYQRRSKALSAAIVLRDCSFRTRSSAIERTSCRKLMREAAIRWRQGTASIH